MSQTLEILQNQIKELPEEFFSALPENEKNIFKNYKLFPIELLVPAPWNYKENDEFMTVQLKNNIKRNGQIVTCQVRTLETGYREIVDGNHRFVSLTELGYKYVIAYDHGPISLAEAQRLAIETNETHFSSNTEKLSELLNALKAEFNEEELAATIPFTAEEFENIINETLDSMNRSFDEIEEDNFDAAPPETPKTVRGDVYELNNHRLLCGDSTSLDDVLKLMDGKKAMLLHTDPPYNISYTQFNKDRNNGNGKDWGEEYGSEWQDSMSDDNYKKFLYDFLYNAKAVLDDWAHYYVWHASTYYRELLDTFERLEIPYDKVPIQWVKQSAPLSWARYKRKSEPCIYGGRGAVNGAGDGARWYGPNNETNIWEINREHSGTYIHPTQKPLALPSRAIANSSKTNDIVLDLFAGSGSTLIASEAMERICYTMEFEPKFCDLVVQRYFKYCEEHSIDCTVRLNGQIITVEHFNNE